MGQLNLHRAVFDCFLQLLSRDGIMGFSLLFLFPFSRINLDGNKLGPAVSYPVPVGTPLISPLVQWDHSQTWDVPKGEDFPSSSGGSSSATVYNIGKKCS